MSRCELPAKVKSLVTLTQFNQPQGNQPTVTNAYSGNLTQITILNETNQRKDREKILIVDDEPINIQVLVNHLSGQAYEVVVALSGIEALEKIKADGVPDLILLDIMMPEMSGYDVCKKIREIYSVAELPIIFLTAKREEKDKIEGFQMGANDYMTKPFVAEELLAKTKVFLRLASEISRKVGDRLAMA